MKRLAAAFVILIIVLSLFGCQKDDEALSSANATPMPDATDGILEDDVVSQIVIGFSLAGEGAFYDQLVSDINTECGEYNFEPRILMADTAAQQESDILSMLSDGAAVITILQDSWRKSGAVCY
jgi:hypothetical protein